MLRKLISIKNVGRFLRYSAAGDVELKRNTLILAENGRGKTTLCAILRSLQSGDARFIRGRATLGVPELPEIKILLADGQIAAFADNRWSLLVPNLAIFDATFVAENVYAGDTVELDHRRNLYGVIVGRRGIELARRIDALDSASREKSAEIRDRRATVQALASAMTPEELVRLPVDPAIEEKIALEERQLAAVREADLIKRRLALSQLLFPGLPPGLEDLLAKTLDNVAADAEGRVAAQIETHAMHSRGQAWLSEGVGYIRDNACPFCGQQLAGTVLITAYKTYFSEAYSALRHDVAAMRTGVDTILADWETMGLERTIDQNTAAVEFWSRYVDLPVINAPVGISGTLRTLREATLTLLDRKLASPLEPVMVDARFTDALATVSRVGQAVRRYNSDVATANAAIDAKKTATGTADVRAVEVELARLQAIRRRHQPDGDAACQALVAAIHEKEAIERDKEMVRQELDNYAQQVMARYQTAINRLLEDFHAGFRIADTETSYLGGIASSSYRIMINDIAVDLGNAETALDRPSFRNTLSAGDRSTLALAFFLAQLDQDPDKAAKAIVFDDPFNSQDAFRKDCTIQKIRRCGMSCAQVIVLSHDQEFLKRIWDRLPTDERKSLKLARVGQQDTAVVMLDIEEVTQATYVTHRKVLLDYYHEGTGDSRDVVQKIRPVLESYSKMLGGDLFAPTDTLGEIVGKIRTAGSTHLLWPLADQLEDLNEYSKRYHHGDNPYAATEPINDTELQGNVKRTLELTGAY